MFIKYEESRDSSAGRASDWRSEGRWFNPGSRQSNNFFVINECEIMKELRNKLKNELEGLDKQ